MTSASLRRAAPVGPAVLVVGGGLIGATTAFTLRLAGFDVTVLDADLPGAAWRAGAGLLTPDGEALDGPLGADARESLRLWPAFARQLETSSDQCIHWRAGVARLQPDGTWAATPGEAALHPPSVVRAALHGLPLRRERVDRVQATPGGVTVHTDQGVHRAERVVLAAGAWSGAFGLNVTAIQGQALLLDGPRDHPALYGARRRGGGPPGYLLGRPDGLYVGATVRPSWRTGPDDHARRWLKGAAQRLAPAHATRPLLNTLVGLRPVTPDHLPLVGPHPTLPGVIVATGHGRHGALLAPLTAWRVLRLLRPHVGGLSGLAASRRLSSLRPADRA